MDACFSFSICYIYINPDLSTPSENHHMHRRLLLITSLVVCCSVFSFDSDQTPPTDSLAYFLDQDDLEGYFRRIRLDAITANRANLPDQIRALTKIKLTGFRPLRASEARELRQAALYLGHFSENLFGDYRAALDFYLLAHHHTPDSVFLDKSAWYIENNIGSIYTRFGDYERANIFYSKTERSLRHFKEFERLSRLYTNLGTQYESQQDTTVALRYFTKGLALADSLGYEKGIFANHLHLANECTAGGQLTKAESHLFLAEKTLDSLIKQEDENLLERMSDLKMAWGHLEKGKKNLQTCLRYYQEGLCYAKDHYSNANRREYAKLYTALAEAYMKLDSLPQADDMIHSGLQALVPEYTERGQLPASHQIYRENSFLPLFVLKSKVLQQKYQVSKLPSVLDTALQCIRLASVANDQIRNPVTMDLSKLVSIHEFTPAVYQGIDVSFMKFLSGDPDAAFREARHLFTQSKGQLYRDKTRRSAAVEMLPEDTRVNIELLENEILDFQKRKYDAHADIVQLNEEILSKREQIHSLFDANERFQPLSTLQGNYIEYSITPETVYALSRLNGEEGFHRLGQTSTLDSLSVRLSHFIQSHGDSDDHQVLEDLHIFLLQPIASTLPSSITIIPDGQLSAVPFEMLKDRAGKFMVENSSIGYAFQFEMYLPSRDENRKKQELFCLAPEYLEQSKAIAVRSGETLEALPFAKMEAESIRAMFGAEAEIATNASKAKCIDNIRNTRLFHYSGHAIVKKDHAYLVLDPERDEKDQLTDKEIGLMHLPMDLVVLSACQTGLGKIEPGEGAMSLGRSFMEAGSLAAVYSLWNVNDRSTADFMKSLYGYIKAGKPLDRAMRQVKLDFIRQGEEGYGHPYHWAAFVAAGDMDPAGRTAWWRWLIAGLLILAAVGILIHFRKRRLSPL